MPSNLHTKILEHVNNPNYQPVKPAVIAKQLGLSGEATHELKKTIKRMVKAGEVLWGPSHLIFAAQKVSPRKQAVDPVIAAAVAPVIGREKDRRKQKLRAEPSGDSKHFTGAFRRAAGYITRWTHSPISSWHSLSL
jgi:hypothetical protein